MPPDPGLDDVRIHIPDNGHRHQGGTVPTGIEVPEILDGTVLDHQRIADGLAGGKAGIAQDFLQEGVAGVLARLAALQALGKDDAALLLDLDGVDGQSPRPVAQDQEGGVHQGGVARRQLQFIHRLPIGSMGIQIRAESRPVALQHPYDAVIRKMLRAVEGHMLQEMRQAPLAFFLVEGPRLHEKPVHRLAFRIGVLEDIIGEAVIQAAHPEGVPPGKRLLPRREQQGGSEKEKGKDETFLHGWAGFSGWGKKGQRRFFRALRTAAPEGFRAAAPWPERPDGRSYERSSPEGPASGIPSSINS